MVLDREYMYRFSNMYMVFLFPDKAFIKLMSFAFMNFTSLKNKTDTTLAK